MMESQVKKIGFKIVLFFLIACSCVFITKTSHAANYGAGSYGAGDYGEGGQSSTSTGSVSAPGCGLAYPGNPPAVIYSGVSNDPNSVTLYFTDATGPFTHYILEYGNSPNNFLWGIQNMGGKGLRTYTINFLAPGTTYYFRIRAANGCAIGAPTNTISVKTKSTIAINQIVVPSVEIEPSVPQKEEKESQAVLGYNVNVHVTDQDIGPIASAKVTIHSDPQEAITDSSGIVRFLNVAEGEHRIIITYNGYEGEQTVTLAGKEKEITINIVIELKSVLFAPQVMVVIGALVLIILILIVMLIRKKR